MRLVYISFHHLATILCAQMSVAQVTIFGLGEIQRFGITSSSPTKSCRLFHGFSGTMSGSNGIDDLSGCYSTPSPALSSMLLANHSPTGPSFSSTSGFANLRNIFSSPFSTTNRSISPWLDNSDAFSDRQQRMLEVPYLSNKEALSSSAVRASESYARDLGHQFEQCNPDEIYAPPGRVTGGLMRDLYPSRFLVSAPRSCGEYVFLY